MDKKVLNYLSNMYSPETDEAVEDVGEELVTDDGMTILAEATSFYNEDEKTEVDVTLMQEYMDFIYLNEEELTFKEWLFLEKVKYTGTKREFESGLKKFLIYGITMMTPFTIVGPALVWIYRNATDDCVKKCGNNNRPCYNKCYYDACDEVVKRIDKEIL